MRIPTRSAPPPPVEPMQSRIWSSSTNDIFGAIVSSQPMQKKKPPPRPPPPNFAQSYAQSHKHRQRPARPTELLTNFFGRKRQEQLNALQCPLQQPVVCPPPVNGSVCLIDLSPPGSPTLTTRSSSDGVSVDSFGSDGNSNPSAFGGTSSGNTSQTESVFEDDFDFFGVAPKRATQADPWNGKPAPDPFGPIEEIARPAPLALDSGNSCFFAFNDHDRFDTKSTTNTRTAPKPVLQTMPTIIRAKPPKPPAPKILQNKLQQRLNVSHQVVSTLTRQPEIGLSNSFFQSAVNGPASFNLADPWSDVNTQGSGSPSPPMPTIPPPPPPPSECLPRMFDQATSLQEPHGIALYDYPPSHPDDLPFREGDLVKLIRGVNDDWMIGEVNGKQGMFPCNFVDIKVPLRDSASNIVTAIYTFRAETTEDLPFTEGDKITVLSRTSEDWLYGECDGRKGQFPANYVNRIPRDIPQT